MPAGTALNGGEEQRGSGRSGDFTCSGGVSIAPESRPSANSIDHLFSANSGPSELAEARGLVGDDRDSRIDRLPAVESWGVPKIRALVEATYFAGLRQAGVPEKKDRAIVDNEGTAAQDRDRQAP
jgi:hypothetical protein